MNYREVHFMFGITDPGIWVGYVLAIGLTIVCVLYGLFSRSQNDGDNNGR